MVIRHQGRYISIILALLVVGVFSAQVPGCMTSYGSKFGRVIDNESGEGIPGVAIVARGQLTNTQSHWCCRGTPACTYSVITFSDEHGDFRLPSEWSRAFPGMPGDSEHYWELYFSKNGYVTADTDLPLRFDTTGGLRQAVRIWDSRLKNVSSTASGVRIPTVELKQAELSLKERIAYFENAAGMGIAQGCPTDSESQGKMQSQIRSIYQAEMKPICGAPSDAQVDSYAVVDLAGIAASRQAFDKRMELIDRKFGWRDQLREPAIYRAGDVCEAMKAGDYK